jgi:hyperosmotically inducible periplasmic protein
MMTRQILAGLALCVFCQVAAGQSPKATPQQPPPPGAAEKIGEKIDRGLTQIGAELSQAWTEVRKGVEKMGVQGRVYGRLRWDKALESSVLDIDVRDNQIVVLKGHVTNEAAKQKAEQLAGETIGVTSVINDLAVTAPK